MFCLKKKPSFHSFSFIPSKWTSSQTYIIHLSTNSQRQAPASVQPGLPLRGFLYKKYTWSVLGVYWFLKDRPIFFTLHCTQKTYTHLPLLQNTPWLHCQVLKPKVSLTNQLYPRSAFPCMWHSCRITVLIINMLRRVILNHLFLPYGYQNKPCLNSWLSGIHTAQQREIHLLLCNWHGCWKTFPDDISLHNIIFFWMLASSNMNCNKPAY